MGKVFFKDTPLGTFSVWNDKPKDHVIHTTQTHSNEIIHYKENDSVEDKEVDGMFFSNELKSKVFCIKTADCMPILIHGQTHSCFLHAGWKGLAQGILKHSLIKDMKPQYAFIGPSIEAYNFEVSHDFQDNFPNSPHFIEAENKYFFNLQQEACDQLKALFPNIIIEQSNVCTFSNAQHNSYRRNKTSLRNWNLFTFSV